jgi:oligopeptidase B
MKLKYLGIPLSLAIFAFGCSSENEKQGTNQTDTTEMSTTTKTTPPTCIINPTTLSKHGVDRVDNYFWLNQRESPEVIDYLNSENDYTDQILKPTEQLQEELFNEMKGRIKEDDESVPFFQNGYHYRTRFIEGGEYPIYERALSKDFSDVEVILDGNELAADEDYFDIGGFSISPNNKVMAYCTDIVSRRQYNIKFKNLETGAVYAESIPNNDGTLAWANDNVSFFYGIQDEESLRSHRIYKHTLNTESKDDQLIFEEKDDTFGCYVERSKSGRYIIIHSSSTLTDEFQFVSTDTPDQPLTMFQERIIGLEYGIDNFEDEFYIVTNKDDATNFKLMKCDISNTKAENWKTILEERDSTLIEDFELFDNHIVITEVTNGLTNIRVINKTTEEDYYLPFNDETYLASPGTNPEFNTTELRVWYTSLTTPSTTYSFDMNTKEEVVLKQQEIVGGYNSEDYQSKRIWITSRDGVRVPMSIVYKTGTIMDGTAPLLQYSYGSYGSSSSPYFSSSRLSLLNRGFIFAIAHIRGGEELGRHWYEDGKMLNKKNTFNDFVDCSQFLIDNQYTSAEHLYAMGGSAGGLLMGAIINDAPELYKGVIAAVPFVDVVTTMLDESIPLTTGEYDEWGNPNEKEYFDYMLSYSPYDQVKAAYFPNLLVTTGLHDSQVQYWEPAKWVAKIRALKTDDNLTLLKTNMTAGHGGASGRFEYLKEVAMEFAFMIALENGSIK